MIRKIKSSIAKFIAAAHIVGSDLADGMDVMRRAHACGWRSTLCFWESSTQSPEDVLEQYLAVLNAVGNAGDQTRISIKPAALRHDFDLLRTALQRAKILNIPLHFDSEHPSLAEQSLRLFERACGEYENVGYTLPARWDRSSTDAVRIIEMQKTVRLVKGQWNDPDDLHGHHIRTRFLRLTEMFTGTKSTVMIATHDKPLARTALNALGDAGTACELEQMFGLPWATHSDTEGGAVVRRMYIPYGTPYLPYNFAFVGERLELFYWILRDCIVRTEKKNELLEITSERRPQPVVAFEKRA